MPKSQGVLALDGEVAFCGQSVQLLARASFRENILFGLPYDETMYRRALLCTHCEELVVDLLPDKVKAHIYTFIHEHHNIQLRAQGYMHPIASAKQSHVLWME